MPDRGVVIGNREEKEEQPDSRARGDAQENYTLPWVRDNGCQETGHQVQGHYSSREGLLSTLPQLLQIITWREVP